MHMVDNSTIDFFCCCSNYGVIRKITIRWFRRFAITEIKN